MDGTPLDKAVAALEEFKSVSKSGHPWIPGVIFINNPGLDKHIQTALEAWVAKKERERSYVEMSKDPHWRPSGSAPWTPRDDMPWWRRILPW